MFRFLFRFIGFWLLAGGFVALIVDGTRSIAASALAFTSVGEAWYMAAPASLERAELSARASWPVLWDHAAAPFLTLPAFFVLVLFGVILMALGRVRERSRFEAA